MRLKLFLSIGIFLAGQSLAQNYTIEGSGEDLTIKSGKTTIQFVTPESVLPTRATTTYLLIPRVRLTGGLVVQEPIPESMGKIVPSREIVFDVDVSQSLNPEKAAQIFSRALANAINRVSQTGATFYVIQPFNSVHHSKVNKFRNPSVNKENTATLGLFTTLEVTFLGIAKVVATRSISTKINIVRSDGNVKDFTTITGMLSLAIEEGSYSMPSTLVDERNIEYKDNLDLVISRFKEAGLYNILQSTLNDLVFDDPKTSIYDGLVYFLSHYPSTLEQMPETIEFFIGEKDFSLSRFQKLTQPERLKFLKLRALGVSVKEAVKSIKP